MRGLQNLSEKGKELLKTLVDMNFTDRSKVMEGILGEGRELMRHFAQSEIVTLAPREANRK